MAIRNLDRAKSPVEVAPFGGINPNNPELSLFPRMYSAELLATRDGQKIVHIVAPLPENYSFQFSTNFDNPFNQPISDSIVQNMSGPASRSISAAGSGVTMTTGMTSIAKWLSGAVWTGGSMFELSIPFVIQAYSDTRREIVSLMRDMLKLTAPSETIGGLLRAPGPYMPTSTSEPLGDVISVRIGKFFEMSPCVVTNVTSDFDTQMDAIGQSPVSVTITVSVRSYWTTTKEDLDKFFVGAAS